jgi:hypothetical protein
MYHTRAVTKAKAETETETKTSSNSPVSTGQMLTFAQPNLQRPGSPHALENILHLHEQRVKAAAPSPK